MAGAIFLNYSSITTYTMHAGALLILIATVMRSSLLLVPHIHIELLSGLTASLKIAYIYLTLFSNTIFIILYHEQLFTSKLILITYQLTMALCCLSALFFAILSSRSSLRSLSIAIGLQNLIIGILGSPLQQNALYLSLLFVTISSIMIIRPDQLPSTHETLDYYLKYWPGAVLQQAANHLFNTLGLITRRALWPFAIGIQVYPLKISLGLARYISRMVHSGSVQRPIFFLLFILFGLMYFAHN